jgi:hypothetical protein
MSSHRTWKITIWQRERSGRAVPVTGCAGCPIGSGARGATRSTTALGHQPMAGLREGLESVVQCYEQNRVWWEPLKS